MKKDTKTEKLFKLTTWGVKIITVIFLLIYLIVRISQTSSNNIFLLFIAPAVFFGIFLLYNFLLVHFYKQGFYTSLQAAEFYTKCCERNISLFQDANSKKVEDVYFSVFGTDKYVGEGTLLSHMTEIYDSGRETTEKQ